MFRRNSDPNKISAWQKLRQEGDRSNRFLPLRIWILIIKLAGGLVAAAFSVPALWSHYAGLVKGAAWIGRTGAAFPEGTMLLMVLLAIFCGYEKTSRSANRWYKILLFAVLTHAGLIYTSAFVEKKYDEKVQREIARRKEIGDIGRTDATGRAEATARIREESLRQRAADIRDRAEERAKKNEAVGNKRGASWLRAQAEIQIAKLYAEHETASVSSDDASALTAPIDEAKIRAEMATGWFSAKMLSIKEGADAYLASVFAILIPFLLASWGLARVLGVLWTEGKHEIAAGGHIRQPADKKAYDLKGTSQLPGWQADAPTFVAQPTRRFTVGFNPTAANEANEADQAPGGGARR